MVEQALYHQYNGGANTVPPLVMEIPDFLCVCSTNVMVVLVSSTNTNGAL
jgi:hypothetical protein